MEPKIAITQDPPSEYVNEGDKVTLDCHPSGLTADVSYGLYFYWIRNMDRVNGSVYQLDEISQKDTGIYTCVAVNGDGLRTSLQWVLMVQCEFPSSLSLPSVCAGFEDHIASHFTSFEDLSIQ